MENILNRAQQEEEKPVRVWRPMPEDHRLFIGCAFLSAGMIILGILLVWGWIAAAAATGLTALAGIFFHFMQQSRLKMENAIIYEEKGEMFMIFLYKTDTKLDKYLRGELEVDLTGKFPGQSLLELAEYSVICHISHVNNIERKEDKCTLYVTYELYPFPYIGSIGIPVRKKCYKNYEGLMELVEFIREHPSEIFKSEVVK